MRLLTNWRAGLWTALTSLAAAAALNASDEPKAQDTREKAASAAAEAQQFLDELSERLKNPVKLRDVPQIALKPRSAPSDEKIARIKELIRQLGTIQEPDYGISTTLSGSAFPPVSGQAKPVAFVFAEHKLTHPAALRDLVAIGPDALPHLLDSLDDKTPTDIRIDCRESPGVSMWLDRELSGNPLNPREAPVLKAVESLELFADPTRSRDFYRAKVSDVCFVAIGQIVGRPYKAVRYQPTACVVLNSPTEDAELCRMVREIWTSDNPRRMLFDSLLRDYSSEGIYHGNSLDVWDIGSTFQCEAALRLLYYFPHESAQLIADRLAAMDVASRDLSAGPNETKEQARERTYAHLAEWTAREVKNGVRTADFVRAVAWSSHPIVRNAITDVFRRTNDEEIMLAAVPGVDDPRDELIPTRLQPLLDALPEDEGPHGQGYEYLKLWTRYAPRSGRTAMEQYLQGSGVQRLHTACAVLGKTQPEWSIEFLRPMLNDTRPLRGWAQPAIRHVNGEQVPIRVCDLAAETIAKIDNSVDFKMEGKTLHELDRQVDHLRRSLNGGQK